MKHQNINIKINGNHLLLPKLYVEAKDIIPDNYEHFYARQHQHQQELSLTFILILIELFRGKNI